MQLLNQKKKEKPHLTDLQLMQNYSQTKLSIDNLKEIMIA